jgi:hypothetical protein
MSTIASLAFAGMMFALAHPSVSFRTDYVDARQQGREMARPLAVFIGSGPEGWNAVAKDGRLGRDVTQLLSDKYVCVYINREEESGRKLAAQFEVPDGSGLVISDRKGDLQAFRHQGTLANDALAQKLERFAEPARSVDQTETIAGPRISHYGAASTVPQQKFYYAPMQSFGGHCAGGG